MKSWFHPWPGYKHLDEWRAEDAWYQTFEPRADADYDTVADYAAQKYDEARERYEAQEKKIEWLFGLAAAATGLLVAFPDRLKSPFGACLPSFVAFLTSMALSLWARLPGVFPSGLAVRSAIQLVRYNRPPKPWIAASQHCAIKAQQLIISWKTDHIQGAVFFLLLGLVFLSFPLSCRAPAGAVPNDVISSYKNRRSDSRLSKAEAAEAGAEVDQPLGSLKRDLLRQPIPRVKTPLEAQHRNASAQTEPDRPKNHSPTPLSQSQVDKP